MKKHLILPFFALVALCAVPLQVVAEDAVPPKPPGGNTAPPPVPAPAPAPGDQQGGAGGRVGPEERLKRMTEALGLTQDQQDKIKGIMEKYAPQFREVLSKGRDNLTEDDKTKIRDLIKSQLEDIGAVLTPEQKEKFQAAMEKRRAAGGAAGAPAGGAAK